MKLNEIIERMNNKYNLNSLDISSSSRELIIMLLSHIKNCSYIDIKLNNIDITDDDITNLEDMIHKVAIDKVPPQYLINKVYVYNEEYYVNENVLIPRQDTEVLIEETIKIIKENKLKTMLDLCTGSGVVGISVACNSPVNTVTLLDISNEALEVAKKNIKINKVESKCTTLVSDLLDKLYSTSIKYDIITANPPYLTETEMDNISEYVAHEPKSALYGGKDGLFFYNKILNEARTFLNNDSFLLLEIGYMQAEAVGKIVSKYAEYTDVKIVKDINQKDRVVICHFQKK